VAQVHSVRVRTKLSSEQSGMGDGRQKTCVVFFPELEIGNSAYNAEGTHGSARTIIDTGTVVAVIMTLKIGLGNECILGYNEFDFF
jgi:hypothetical protein